MKTRKLGRTGFDVGEIGMGLEHLLNKDERTVVETIAAAKHGGVNYLDCHMGDDYETYDYDGYRKLGRALAGKRNHFILSHISPRESFASGESVLCLESYLKAVNADHTDVFIIPFCDRETEFEDAVREGGQFELAERLVKQGKARAVGISTHSSSVALKAIAHGGFDMLMYPVNPAFDVLTDGVGYETENLGSLWDAAHDFKSEGKTGRQPRRNVYEECARNNVGIAAMKPFAGGFIFNVEEDASFTPINLISYALAQTGVSTVVPGCTKPSEIEEILRYYTCCDAEREFGSAVANSRWSVRENCLYCNHCLPCCKGINIGEVNRLIDTRKDFETARKKYFSLSAKASDCDECGCCEECCPFGVKVTERMKLAAEIFGK